MPSRVDTLDLEVSPAAALVACRRALAELGWSADASDGRVSGREDDTKLCCHQSPVSIEVELRANADGGTGIRMTGSVPGVGPVSSGHLRTRMEALWRHLLAAAR